MMKIIILFICILGVIYSQEASEELNSEAFVNHLRENKESDDKYTVHDAQRFLEGLLNRGLKCNPENRKGKNTSLPDSIINILEDDSNADDLMGFIEEFAYYSDLVTCQNFICVQNSLRGLHDTDHLDKVFKIIQKISENDLVKGLAVVVGIYEVDSFPLALTMIRHYITKNVFGFQENMSNLYHDLDDSNFTHVGVDALNFMESALISDQFERFTSDASDSENPYDDAIAKYCYPQISQ